MQPSTPARPHAWRPRAEVAPQRRLEATDARTIASGLGEQRGDPLASKALRRRSIDTLDDESELDGLGLDEVLEDVHVTQSPRHQSVGDGRDDEAGELLGRPAVHVDRAASMQI